MRQPDLIIKTIELMKPVYALLETKKLTPELQQDALGDAADSGKAPEQPAKRGTDGAKTGQSPKKKKPKPRKKSRGVHWDDDQAGAAGAEEDAEAMDLGDESKTPEQETADRCASCYVPVVLAIDDWIQSALARATGTYSLT